MSVVARRIGLVAPTFPEHPIFDRVCRAHGAVPSLGVKGLLAVVEEKYPLPESTCSSEELSAALREFYLQHSGMTLVEVRDSEQQELLEETLLLAESAQFERALEEPSSATALAALGLSPQMAAPPRARKSAPKRNARVR